MQSDRAAALLAQKLPNFALPRRDAVAPVRMIVPRVASSPAGPTSFARIWGTAHCAAATKPAADVRWSPSSLSVSRSMTLASGKGRADALNTRQLSSHPASSPFIIELSASCSSSLRPASHTLYAHAAPAPASRSMSALARSRRSARRPTMPTFIPSSCTNLLATLCPMPGSDDTPITTAARAFIERDGSATTAAAVLLLSSQ